MPHYHVSLLPGDGIGPEITSVTKAVLEAVSKKNNFELSFNELLIGGQSIEQNGSPLPKETLEQCLKSDAVLLAAIGSPQYDTLPRALRPETGLLELRSGMNLFANLRPIKVYDSLIESSTLKEDVIKGVDLLVVRELTGGIYFGEPKGRVNTENDERAFNTMTYSASEIERISQIAFNLSLQRKRKLCSVDKANVLDVSQLWREKVSLISDNYPEIEFTNLYVDNAAMQLIQNPRQFDVILTGNLFGDILSDEAAMLTGSIGMLPSASLSKNGPGLFEPVHGSAPDIAGENKANPMAMVLSAAMMLRIGFKEEKAADDLEKAVDNVLNKGLRTADLISKNCTQISCSTMKEVLLKEI
tara:strand:- start:364 stop:1437 length:1074 start_codon:yes stop_codon:yes gene_type:complete